MLSIVASMQRELPSLAKRRKGESRDEFEVLGIGPDRAAGSMSELLSRNNVEGAGHRRAVLLVGFAGGTDPGLKTGDLVLASSYCWLPPGIDARGTGPLDSFEPDQALLRIAHQAAAKAGLNAYSGPSVTVDSMVHSAKEKLLIYKAFAASSVNMEDYASAEAAAGAGTPFLSARVVLDPQGQTLPSDLIELAAAGFTAAVNAAAKPWQLPLLLSLYARMRRSQAVLSRFTNAFIAEYRDWEEQHYPGLPGDTVAKSATATQMILRPGTEAR